MKIILLISFLISTSLNVFATTKEDVKKETSEAVLSASQYTKEQKDEFQKEMQIKIDNLKRDLAEMNKTATKKSASIREEMKKEIAKLENEQKKMSQNLTKLGKSTGKAWDEVKAGVSKSWNDLADAFEKAKGKYKEEK